MTLFDKTFTKLQLSDILFGIHFMDVFRYRFLKGLPHEIEVG
jgi:hypothetical protein